MDEIEPGLYLGSVEAALDVKELEAKSIKAVLTISNISLEQMGKELQDKELLAWYGFDGIGSGNAPKHLYIEANDSNNQELITYFDETCAFIKENLEKHNVLVHCWAGRSRSVTLVAAYLMKHRKMSVAEALEKISSVRPILCPMRGFIEQLHLYARFGCRFDDVNEECKKWYRSMIEEWLEKKEEEQPKRVSQVVKALLLNTDNSDNPEGGNYRCRRCGTAVFNSTDLVEHERGRGVIEFVDHEGVQRRKGEPKKEAKNCHDSIFVDPLPWMSEVILQMDGKINCPNPKCGSKLGSFTWVGDRCRCGRWVTPAFHMLPDRVEQRGKITLVPTFHPTRAQVSASK